MASTTFSSRPELQRTNSWPSAIRNTADLQDQHRSRSSSMSATIESRPTFNSFEEDLEDHPEDHFLSSIYGYEDWAEDDDDDDDEEFEWNAGITDFALFNEDRRRAQETHDELPGKWDDLLSRQAAALRRSAQRIRADAASDPRTGGLFAAEDMPELTPDNSPNLRDDLEDGETFRYDRRMSNASSYSLVSIIVTPPPEDAKNYSGGSEAAVFDEDNGDEYDDEPPLSFFVDRAEKRKAEIRKLQRPGLRNRKTLSGKAHVWRRPSWDIYPVGEDPAAEEKAEREDEEV